MFNLDLITENLPTLAIVVLISLLGLVLRSNWYMFKERESLIWENQLLAEGYSDSRERLKKSEEQNQLLARENYSLTNRAQVNETERELVVVSQEEHQRLLDRIREEHDRAVEFANNSVMLGRDSMQNRIRNSLLEEQNRQLEEVSRNALGALLALNSRFGNQQIIENSPETIIEPSSGLITFKSINNRESN